MTSDGKGIELKKLFKFVVTIFLFEFVYSNLKQSIYTQFILVWARKLQYRHK